MASSPKVFLATFCVDRWQQCCVCWRVEHAGWCHLLASKLVIHLHGHIAAVRSSWLPSAVCSNEFTGVSFASLIIEC